MREWQLAAVAAAMMTTHAAPAAAEALVSAGLSSDTGPGGVLGVTAQPGKPLSRNFRLRIEYDLPVLPGGSQMANAKPRPRRVATMLDYYPDADSGFRLSAGMRFLSKRLRQAWNPYKDSAVGSLIYAPAMGGRLPIRTNVAQTVPAMTLGWTRSVSDMAVFGLEAGTIMNHGSASHALMNIAQSQLKAAGWSRVDPVAQVAFALKF